ncbi:MAG: protease inhibitor I42 family protein, partial [Desulfomonile tiedjei]|nr:protease inhibitor I42 family protein [Desulfomonile tiedjei]
MSYSKLLTAALLVLISFVAVWASNNDAETVRDETHISAQAHKSFRIVLPSNPSTGYSWTADFDKSFLKLQSSRYIKPAQQIPGRGGQHVCVFLPLKGGETTIEMKYKRPW